MPDTRLTIQPMSPFGAEVIGPPAGAESDPEIRAALYEAWLQHGILLFRNVDSVERHLSLSRSFGELEVHPFPEIRCKDNPLLVEIGGKSRSPAYVFDGRDMKVGVLPWHRDTAYTPDICKGAMLRMVEVPSSGGETMFADTAAAYDDLPADIKAKLEGLEYRATLRITVIAQTRPGAFWKTVRAATPEEDPQGGLRTNATTEARYPSVVHPAVLVHPESGRKCIFLSPTYVDCFLGMAQAESDAFLEYLVAHMLKPCYVQKHRWAVNDAILWDNRRVMHAGCGNKLNEPRKGLRTTLAGSVRTGRFFDTGANVDALPLMAD